MLSLFGDVKRSFYQITVLDANDNPPQFERDTEWESAYDPPPRECHRTVTITDGAPTDAFVLRLTASDADVNDTIIYRLVSGSGSDDMFRVDERNKFVSWRPPQTPEAKARLASALFAYEAGQRGSGGLSFEVRPRILPIKHKRPSFVVYFVRAVAFRWHLRSHLLPDLFV